MKGERELQDVPPMFRLGCSFLGGAMITGGLALIAMHAHDQARYPTPADLQVEFLLGFGFALLLAVHFPWTKIRIGDLEIERAIEQQIDSAEQEGAELRKIIEDLEGRLREGEHGAGRSKELLMELDRRRAQELQHDQLLERFLDQWKTSGFTASRIASWGPGQNGFEALSDEPAAIRASANRLVAQRKAKTRISRRGNVLYQKA